MSLWIAPKALEKWASNDLDARKNQDGSYDFVFRYEGSSCRNGGKGFPAEIRVCLSFADDGDWCIKDLTIVVPPVGREGWEASCIFGEIGKDSLRRMGTWVPFRGQRLDEALASDATLNHGGCFCTPAHVNHKVLLALGKIRWWLDNKAKA